MTQVLLYTTDAGLVPVDEKPTLEVLQRLVGGYVELVKMPRGILAWCDEEGLLKRLSPSLVVEHRAGYPVSLCGPVVFVVPRAASPEEAMARVLPCVHVSNRSLHPSQQRVR